MSYQGTASLPHQQLERRPCRRGLLLETTDQPLLYLPSYNRPRRLRIQNALSKKLRWFPFPQRHPERELLALALESDRDVQSASLLRGETSPRAACGPHHFHKPRHNKP